MRGVVLLFMLGGCDLVFELRDPPATPVRRRTITLTPPIASPVTDFPISVVLDGDDDLRDHLRADAKDLRFEIDDATLAHELVGFDPMTGALEAWVKIPTLTRPMTVDMRYGDGLEMSVTADVWGNSTAAAWHLGESGIAFDSTKSGIALRPTTQTVPGTDAGIVGGARKFSGNVDEVLCADPSEDFDPGNTGFSYSLWVFVDQPSSAADRPLTHGGGSSTQAGYNFELGTEGWIANVSDSKSQIVQGVLLQEPPLVPQWTHLAGVLQRSGGMPELRAYANGLEGAPGDATTLGSLETTRTTCLSDDGIPFLGLIDEVRIYRKLLTIDEITAEHANLARREQFMQIADAVVE